MNCQQSEELLMRFDALTASEKEELTRHAVACAACAEALAFIQTEQQWVSKIDQAQPVHAAALTQKIMQALPPQKARFSFGFLNLARAGYAAGLLIMFFWLGSELLVEKTFLKPATVGPVLNSSAYISHPQRETKTNTVNRTLKSKRL